MTVSRVSRAGALGAVAVLLVASSCGDTEPAADPARDLSAASLTALEETVWVFGGWSAPVGTTPPVTSTMPPGWEPNRDVTVYDRNGKVARNFELPPEVDRPLTFGRVFASGGDHYLLGTQCEQFGCAAAVEPVLIRFSDDTVESVDLDLPPLDARTEFPILHIIGQTASTAWALQQVGPGSVSPSVNVEYRLLAIDLPTGAVTEVDLDEGVHGPAWLCIGTDRLFRVAATFDHTTNRVRRARVLWRPADPESGGWQELAILPIGGEPVLFGNLHCLTAQDSLLITHGLPSSRLVTLAMSNGQETEAQATLPGSPTQYLGNADAGAIVFSVHDEPTLWRHPPSGPWQAIADPNLNRTAHPVVLAGELFDAQDLLRQSGKPSAHLVPIAI